MSWIVPPIWVGEPCYILACGYSLAAAPTHLLEGRHVIAINDAYLRLPTAEFLYFCDGQKWWDQYGTEVLQHFRGRYLVTTQQDCPHKIPNVRTLRLTNAEGLETDPGALCHGSNSAYQALGLAYHLGATRIVLLGLDMHTRHGQSHWRRRPVAREQNPAEFQQTMQRHMLPKFESLVAPLKKAGVEVINCTPDSDLKCWLQRDLREVLQEEDARS